MVLKLTSRKSGNYTFVEAELLGKKVSLTKALVERECALKRFKKGGEWEVPADAELFGVQKGKYVNLYIGLAKPKPDAVQAEAGQDAEALPF